MFPSVSMILIVAAGGALGSAARYVTGFLLSNLWGSAWPYGTFTVNFTGSFLIGLISALLITKYPDPRLAAFLIAGFLGGFTTFSSFMNETFQFLTEGRFPEGLTYLALQLAAGLFAVAAGILTGKYLA